MLQISSSLIPEYNATQVAVKSFSPISSDLRKVIIFSLDQGILLDTLFFFGKLTLKKGLYSIYPLHSAHLKRDPTLPTISLVVEEDGSLFFKIDVT